MISKLKPVIVLAAIMTIVSALLIVTYNLTYVDTSGILTDELREKCVVLCGEGEYSIITDWKAEGYSADKPENVEKLIKKNDGAVLFQIITSGYTKNGLDLLIAMNNDGSVKGIEIVSISETPGLGTKVEDKDFLSGFSGVSEEITIVKKAPAADNEIQAMTGATFSSEGVADAVNIAIKTYREMGAAQ